MVNVNVSSIAAHVHTPTRRWANTTWSLALGAGVAAAVALGLFGRLNGLGRFPLAVDEYYFVQSVKNILEHGIPAFETGGYYARGLLPQYLTAGAVLLFGDDGFAYRLPAAAFSVGAIPLAFVYGRRLLGLAGGVTLAVLLLVSAWEIEFGRFARMYAALQFLTLLYLIALDKAAERHDSGWTYVPHVVLLATYVTHEFAIVLAPFLFLPLLPTGERPQRPRYVLWLVTAAVAWFCIYFKTDLRDFGVTNAMPADYEVMPGLPKWRLPPFPFFGGVDPNLILRVYVGLSGAVALAFALRRYLGRPARESDYLGALLLIAAVFHQFLIAGAILLAMAARGRLLDIRSGKRPLLPIPLLAGAVAMLWLGYALWMQLGGASPGGASVRVLARTFVGWPNLLDPVVMPWLRHLPLLALAAAAAFLHQVFTKAQAPLGVWIRHPAIVIVPILVAFSLRSHQYSSIRFSFFIYPLVLALILLAAIESATWFLRRRRHSERLGQITGSLACVAVFGLSGDFNLRQITDVAGPAVRLRLDEFERYEGIWYGRWDYESPAAFVNEQAGVRDGDRVLVVDQPPASFYLRMPHAVYYDRASTKFFNVSRAGGTVDLWSNQRLLSTPADLRAYTACAARVWMIAGVSPDQQRFDTRDVWGDRLVETGEAFRSVDRRLDVRLLRLRIDPSC